MSADVACTRCGRASGLTLAYFCDRFKQPTAATACRYCGLLWPVLMSTRMAAEMLVLRGDGAVIEEAAQ